MLRLYVIAGRFSSTAGKMTKPRPVWMGLCYGEYRLIQGDLVADGEHEHAVLDFAIDVGTIESAAVALDPLFQDV